MPRLRLRFATTVLVLKPVKPGRFFTGSGAVTRRELGQSAGLASVLLSPWRRQPCTAAGQRRGGGRRRSGAGRGVRAHAAAEGRRDSRNLADSTGAARSSRPERHEVGWSRGTG